MQRYRIALIVDHPARDLGGLTLVAHALAMRGIDCFLTPMFFQRGELLALRPDFVLFNYIRGNNSDIVDMMRTAGIKYGLLDTEGGFFGDMAHYGRLLSRHERHWKDISCICAWSETIRTYLDQEGVVAASKIATTGQPRFDLYAPKFRKQLKTFLPPQWRQTSRQFLLINTKVSIANPRFVSVSEDVRIYRDLLGIPQTEIDRHLSLGRAAIAEVCELAIALAGHLPHVDLVIRPHPHENPATYRSGTRSGRGIHVLSHGSISPWINQAKVVIHRHCTTAVEAAIAGVPALAPQWVPTSAFAPDAEAVSLRSNSFDELAEHATSGVAGKLSMPESVVRALDAIVDRWLFAIDGSSALRVADAICRSLPEKREVNDDKINELLKTHEPRLECAGLDHDPLSGFRLAINRLRRSTWSLGSVRASFHRMRWQYGGKGFTVSDVRDWIGTVDTTSPATVCVSSAESPVGSARLASVKISPVSG